MKVTKLSKNRIRVESKKGLLYTPSNQAYRVVECPCAFLQYIEELTVTPEAIAAILSL